jgi:hypothetical protein
MALLHSAWVGWPDRNADRALSMEMPASTTPNTALLR